MKTDNQVRPNVQTESEAPVRLHGVVKRIQKLHTAVSLLEAACMILERATIDGIVDMHPKVARWCKQIRSQQQALVKEIDSPNEKAQ